MVWFAWLTIRVKDCEAFGEVPFEAVMTRLYEPLVPAAGVPLKVAVPFWLSTKVTPLGRAPVSASAGVGEPLAVTVKAPAVPGVKVALLPLVMTGA